MGQERLIMKKK